MVRNSRVTGSDCGMRLSSCARVSSAAAVLSSSVIRSSWSGVVVMAESRAPSPSTRRCRVVRSPRPLRSPMPPAPGAGPTIDGPSAAPRRSTDQGSWRNGHREHRRQTPPLADTATRSRRCRVSRRYGCTPCGRGSGRPSIAARTRGLPRQRGIEVRRRHCGRRWCGPCSVLGCGSRPEVSRVPVPADTSAVITGPVRRVAISGRTSVRSNSMVGRWPGRRLFARSPTLNQTVRARRAAVLLSPVNVSGRRSLPPAPGTSTRPPTPPPPGKAGNTS